MLKLRFLVLLSGFIVLLSHLSVAYGMDELEGGASMQRPHAPPNFFYRISDPQNVTAVYAKQVLYNSQEAIDLFETPEDIVPLRDFVWHKGKEKEKQGLQYLAVVFFGIWKDDSQALCRLVQIPVREFTQLETIDSKDGDNKEDDFGFLPFKIWKPGARSATPMFLEELEKAAQKKNDFDVSYECCPNSHTEKRFTDNFINDPNNLQVIWKYFIYKSKLSKINVNEADLRLVGFKFYSTNDACDRCFKILFDLQNNPADILTHLLPKREEDKPAFQILFHAKGFFNVGGNNAGGSSLHYGLDSNASLTPASGAYSISSISDDDAKKCLKISHQKAVQMPENERHNHIIIKINEGEDAYAPQ